MTHPLTDEIIEDILLNRYWWELEPCQDALRAAADWQLEQVIKYLEDDYLIVLWSNHLPVSAHMDRFKKAMRPQEDSISNESRI